MRVPQNSIDRSKLTEVRVHHFMAEASELRFPPGFWPSELYIDGVGNGQPFDYDDTDSDGNTTYSQRLGCVTLLVVND